jgi:DNA-binding CsgD family transcriptional regulator
MNAIVLFGDVIRSRRNASGSTTWLRTLTAELEAATPPESVVAPFEFTQGDELQGLLASDTDPLDAVLRASFNPDRSAMRWVIVAGEVDPGTGPATQRTGPAFLRARERLAEAGARRDNLLMSSGDPGTDALLDRIAPVLAEMLGDLTKRQMVIGRLLVIEGLRRSEAADRLHISRATVSVVADRAHIRSITRLASALRELFAAGQGAAAAGEATGRPNTAREVAV